jgi:hypothetical protein
MNTIESMLNHIASKRASLMVVSDFPEACRSDMRKAKDWTGRPRTRMLGLLAPSAMSNEICDRLKRGVRHFALKHFNAAAKVVAAPHGRNRHGKSHHSRHQCLGKARRYQGDNGRFRHAEPSERIHHAENRDK